MRAILLRILVGMLVASVTMSQGAFATPVLRIAAASDLRPVGTKWVERFQQRYPDLQVDIVYGSSGKLSRQIEQGAPFDIFFSADERYPAQLSAQGHAHGMPRRYAKGRLVLWWPREQDISWQSLEQADVRHIAIAHPDHAPYGQRAQQAIQRQAHVSILVDKLVRGENVAQAMQYVVSGAADAGIVARSLMSNAMSNTSQGRFALVDESLHDPLWQSVMLTAQVSDAAMADAFLDLVFSDEGQALLQEFGFDLP